jgi:hypothetical protein
MPGKFDITISATDKATAVADKVFNAVAKIEKPISDLGKASKRTFEVAGAERFGKSISNIGTSALRAVSDLKSIGPLGFIGSLGTIGGLAELSDRWGRLGNQLVNTAAVANVSASNLSRMRSAAQLAGGSGDALSSSLASLADVTNDALNGRNNTALGTLQQLGVHLARLKDGSIDTRKEFLDLLDAIQQQPNAQTQNLLARTFGIDSGLLTSDVRKRGAGGFLDAERRARERGDQIGEDQIKGMKDLGDSWLNLKSSISGVFNRVEANLGPATKSVVDWFDRHIKGNTEDLAGAVEAVSAAGAAAGVAALPGVTSSLLAGSLTAAAGGALGAGGVALGAGALYFAGMKSGAAMGKLAEPSGLMSAEGFGISIPSSTDEAGRAIAIPPSVASRAGAAVVGRGGRFNNPLNLMPGGIEARYGSEEAGIEAAAENLLAYRDKYGTDTVSGIVSRWAPSSAGNDVGSYIHDVTQRTGFAPNEELDLHNPQVLSTLIGAMGRHESGREISPELIASAVADALSRQPIGVNLNVTMSGAPKDTRVTATDENGYDVPVRVQFRLPASERP